MFSREQIDDLYYLVEKGAITKEDADKFIVKKLQESGFEVTPLPAPENPPAPEAPAEPAPPAPEAAPVA